MIAIIVARKAGRTIAPEALISHTAALETMWLDNERNKDHCRGQKFFTGLSPERCRHVDDLPQPARRTRTHPNASTDSCQRCVTDGERTQEDARRYGPIGPHSDCVIQTANSRQVLTKRTDDRKQFFVLQVTILST